MCGDTRQAYHKPSIFHSLTRKSNYVSQPERLTCVSKGLVAVSMAASTAAESESILSLTISTQALCLMSAMGRTHWG